MTRRPCSRKIVVRSCSRVLHDRDTLTTIIVDKQVAASGRAILRRAPHRGDARQRGPGRARHGRGHARRRRADVRRDRRAVEPHRERAARALGRPRRPGAVVGRHVARGGSRVRGAGQDRRGLRAAERARVARRGRARRRVRPAAAAVVRRVARRGRGAELAARVDVPFSPEIPTGDARPRPTRPSSTSATRTSSSSRAGAPGGRRASCSRTARTGCARTSARRRPPGGAGTVCMFPLFHMAGWTIALGAWQGRRPVHFVRTPDAETLLHTTARHRAARLYCIPAVWSRILEHGVGGFDLSSLEEADTGTSATPPELLARDQGRAPPHRDPRLLRLDRSGPGRAARRRRPLPQAGQRRRRATGRRGAPRPTTARS